MSPESMEISAYNDVGCVSGPVYGLYSTTCFVRIQKSHF